MKESGSVAAGYESALKTVSTIQTNCFACYCFKMISSTFLQKLLCFPIIFGAGAVYESDLFVLHGALGL